MLGQYVLKKIHHIFGSLGALESWSSPENRRNINSTKFEIFLVTHKTGQLLSKNYQTPCFSWTFAFTLYNIWQLNYNWKIVERTVLFAEIALFSFKGYRYFFCYNKNIFFDHGLGYKRFILAIRSLNLLIMAKIWPRHSEFLLRNYHHFRDILNDVSPTKRAFLCARN